MSILRSWSPDSEHPSPRYYLRMVQRHPAYRASKRPLNAVKSVVSSSFRMATQQWRHLPTAVIVGAQKAGTTQLHAHLIKHPRCFSGAEKEVSYFSKFADRPLEWYRSRFPFRWRVQRCRGHVLDASPSYLSGPRALRRMQAALPDARIIVILRDPVSRAYSNYHHAFSRHKDTREFDEAIAAELRQNLFPPRSGVALRPDARPMTYYLARGYYALQLELLFALYPRQQVLILDSADLFADTGSVCQRVFDFLGLEHYDVHPEKIYNRGYYQKRIDPVLAERLRHHFRPYDELLVQVTGRTFSWMKPQDVSVPKAA